MESTSDASLLPETIAALSTAFDAELPASERVTLEAVRQFVIGQVAAFLYRRPEYLMHVLYRVDVAEADVKAAFEEAAPGDLAPRLADLLIERQLQKMRLRRRYARSSS